MKNSVQQLVSTFLQGETGHNHNASTDGKVLILHTTAIARKTPAGFKITTGGWNTPTTKRYLNELPGVHVQTVKKQLMLNGRAWDGKPTVVSVQTA